MARGNEGWRVGEGRRWAISRGAVVEAFRQLQGPSCGGIVFRFISFRPRIVWPQQGMGSYGCCARSARPGPIHRQHEFSQQFTGCYPTIVPQDLVAAAGLSPSQSRRWRSQCTSMMGPIEVRPSLSEVTHGPSCSGRLLFVAHAGPLGDRRGGAGNHAVVTWKGRRSLQGVDAVYQPGGGGRCGC